MSTPERVQVVGAGRVVHMGRAVCMCTCMHTFSKAVIHLIRGSQMVAAMHWHSCHSRSLQHLLVLGRY
jgi:hypothetical protein